MAENRKAVRTGGGSDYTTWQTFEDDLDDGTNASVNTTAYGAGDDAVGEGYPDSDFDANCLWNGGGTVGLNSLTVTSNTKHLGVEDTGVRILRTTNATIWDIGITYSFRIEWIEIDGNQNASVLDIQGIDNIRTNTIVEQCLIHGFHCSTNGFVIGLDTLNNQISTIQNNMVYDFLTGDTGADIIKGIDPEDGDCYNNTVHDLTNNSGTGACNGIQGYEPGSIVNNCISTDTSGTTSGSVANYAGIGGAEDYNAASDNSDGGANSIGADDGVTSAGLFISNSAPYNLLHKSGALNIGAGVDLGDVGAKLSIDNVDRHATAVLWDMGAGQLVAAVGVEIFRRRIEGY